MFVRICKPLAFTSKICWHAMHILFHQGLPKLEELHMEASMYVLLMNDTRPASADLLRW